MKAFTRVIAMVLVFLLTVSVMPVDSLSAYASTTTTTQNGIKADIKRLGGTSRYETAFTIANEGWEKAKNVIVVSAQSYADALAGVPLAYALDAPILLAGDQTLSQLKELEAENIYILGGTLAVSETYEKSFKQNGYTVKRISGKSRYETAVAVAKDLIEIEGKPKYIFIASGANYPDALSASSAAAIMGCPIFYSPADGVLDKATIAAIKETGAKRAYVLGGTVAVGDKINDSLDKTKVTRINRLGGDDRYSTSLIINEFFDKKFSSDDVAFATGKNYPDALAGGVFAAKMGIPVLLTDNATVDCDLKDYIADKDPDVAYIFGGEVAVSEEIVKKHLPGGEDAVNVTVTFNANGENVQGLPSTQNVTTGSLATEPVDPTREGYAFGGWYTEAECVNEFDFSTQIIKAVTLYAKWELIKIELTEEELDEIVRGLFSDAEKKTDEEANYKELDKSLEFEDESSPITKVTVTYILENDSGGVFMKEYTGKEYFQNTAGALSVPVDIEVVGDAIEKAIITFTYDKSKLGNVNPNNLGIAYYDEDGDIAVLVDNVIVDVEACTITVETDHFSSWVVVDTSEWVEAWTKQLPVIRNNGSNDEKEVFYNIVLAIDGSGSMDGTSNTLSKEAANELVKFLKDNDILSVVCFASSATTIMDATYVGKTTLSDISQKINSISAGGGTDFCAGLNLSSTAITDSLMIRALNPWFDDRSYNRDDYDIKNIVIFLSDGHDSNSISEIESAISAIVSVDAMVISVGLGSGASETTLKKIAQETGGDYYFAKSATDLTVLYNQIAGQYIGSDMDTDGDGLPDIVESLGMRTSVGEIIKTNPTNEDSDGDGIADGIEMGEYSSTDNYFSMPSHPLIKTVYHDYSMPTDVESYVTPAYNVQVSDVEEVDYSEFNICFKLNHTDYEVITKQTSSITGETTITEIEHFYEEPSAAFMLISCNDACMANTSYAPNFAKNDSAVWNCQCLNAHDKKKCGATHSISIKLLDSFAEPENHEFAYASPIYSISEAMEKAQVEYAKRLFEQMERAAKALPGYTPPNYANYMSPKNFTNDFRTALEDKVSEINTVQTEFVDPAREKIKDDLIVEMISPITGISLAERTAMSDAVETYIINMLSEEALNKDFSNVFKGWKFDMTSVFDMISFEDDVIRKVWDLCNKDINLKGELTYNGITYSVTSNNQDVVGSVFGKVILTDVTSGQEFSFVMSGSYRESLTIFIAITNNLYNSIEETVRDTVSVWKIPGYIAGYLDLCDFGDFIGNEIDYTKEIRKFFKSNSFGSDKYKKLTTFATARLVVLELTNNLENIQTGIDGVRELIDGKTLDEIVRDIGADAMLDQVEEIEDSIVDSVNDYFRNAIFN